MSEEAVIMLTWEFPPRIVGGIAPHVYNLSKALVKLGLRVHVVTCDFPDTPNYEEVDGVIVHRFDSYKSPTPDFASWVYLMNTNMQRKAIQILKSLRVGRTLIHAHDWLTARAGVGVKYLFRIPLVATIHATEYGRRGGLYSDYNRMIHQTEVWLGYEAWRVICCSNFMATQVNTVLGIPRNKVDIIPNGVDPQVFDVDGVNVVRERFASPSEKLILFVGRLVHEKGLGVLMDAIPKVISSANAKFVIVGDGYMRERLVAQTMYNGVANKVFVTGFLEESKVRALFRSADVCVVPSLYEPFGIVALEAMAAKTPVVVSDTGGLAEIVEPDTTGVRVHPNNPESLASGILKVIQDSEFSSRLRRQAYTTVIQKYSWKKIAETTAQLYRKVFDEYSLGSWRPDLS